MMGKTKANKLSLQGEINMNFVLSYVKASTLKEKVECFIAKMIGARVVTPLGRIMLLPADYDRLAIATGNEDMI